MKKNMQENLQLVNVKEAQRGQIEPWSEGGQI